MDWEREREPTSETSTYKEISPVTQETTKRTNEDNDADNPLRIATGEIYGGRLESGVPRWHPIAALFCLPVSQQTEQLKVG
jgi:hypothetical protein